MFIYTVGINTLDEKRTTKVHEVLTLIYSINFLWSVLTAIYISTMLYNMHSL